MKLASVQKIIDLQPIEGADLIEKATWFVDPPYQFGGEAYKYSNKKINYQTLSKWCINREGQLIVCENSKADWMDFKPIIEQRGTIKKGIECIYTNEYTQYDNIQTKLF